MNQLKWAKWIGQKISESGPLAYFNSAAILLLMVLVVIPKLGGDVTPLSSDSPTFEVPMVPGQVSPIEICERAAENDAIGVLPTDGGLRYLAQYGASTIEWVRNPNVNNSLGFVDGVDQPISEEVKECLIENASLPQ